MLSQNLLELRKRRKLTQEQAAFAIGVSRQALSKWETGESVPDLGNCLALADFYGVTLDNLVRYNAGEQGLPIPPKGKHCFGTLTVGPEGELVLPRKALELFQIAPGEVLLLLGEEDNGLALVRREEFLSRFQKLR